MGYNIGAITTSPWGGAVRVTLASAGWPHGYKSEWLTDHCDPTTSEPP